MIAWFVRAALGQESPPIDAQLFHPSIGSHRTVWVDEVGTVDGAPFHSGLVFHYTNDPLVYTAPDGTEEGLLTDVLALDTLVGIHAGRLAFGVDVPVLLFVRGAGEEGSALGDVSVDGKVIVLDRQTAPLGLGIGGRVYVPTATTELAVGTEEPELEVQLAAEQEVGPLLIVGNVGLATGPEVELERVTVGDFVVARLGGGWAFGEHTGAALEATARFATTAPVASSATTAQWLGSVYTGLGNGVSGRIGGGTGLGDGIGSPDFRLLVGLGWAPEHEEVELEPVAEGPECPEEGEPPGVTIDLRVVDAAHAPIASATSRVEGMVDDCGHGAHAEQEVVLEDAARTGPAAFRQGLKLGDHEVSVDLVLSPNLGEKPVVTFDGDRITMSESVKFETASATILPDSYPLLDEVVALLHENPAVEQVRIEGHTDARGTQNYNLVLSRARAASVRTYLVGQGVPANRLTSDGFGEMMPLDPRSAPEAWAVNRRVDLFVERREE